MINLIPITILIIIVLGSIYSGIATPSEAAAVGVLATIVLTVLTRQLSMEVFLDSLMGAVRTSCMIASILLAAAFLSTSMAFLHVPQEVAAGIAKLNSDWLFEAMPLKIWLTSKYDIPIIGDSLLQLNWVHYLMSWGGMIYDLSIPFLLIYKRTRNFAFFMVVVFHVFTRILFPIGVFPYVMIISALIFFDNSFHEKIINYLKRIILAISIYKTEKIKNEVKYTTNKSALFIVSVFFAIQIALPLRSVFYPDNIMWHEQGYRFSWRVMLMEKIGYTTFLSLIHI